MTKTGMSRLFTTLTALMISAAEAQDLKQPVLPAGAKTATLELLPVSMLGAVAGSIRSAYANGGVSGSIIPGCDTAKSGKTTPSAIVVRLHIRNDFFRHLLDGKACKSCLEMTQAVQACQTPGTSCLDDDTNVNPVALPGPNAPGMSQPSGTYSTRLDVNLTKAVWQEPNHQQATSILIKVMLDDPNMTFMRKPGADPADSDYAIRSGVNPDPMDNDLFDCRQPIVTSGFKSYVEFRIPFPTTKPTAIGSLNIGVVVTDRSDNGGFVLPIILDPKVPNNG